MSEKNFYLNPMEPYPTLASFANNIKLETNGMNIFYFEAGKKNEKTILMIHGLGDEADTWRHVIQPLAERFHVIAMDLPGFGRSDKPATKYSPGFFKYAIIELMDALSLNKVILMGSSLGAILAQDLTLTHEDRVEGLILVDGGLLQIESMGGWSFRLMLLPLIGEWLYTRLRKDPQAAFNSLGNVYSDLAGLPEPDRTFLFTRVNKRVWSDGQRRAYFSTLRKLTAYVLNQQSTLPDKLFYLETPTLVIHGQNDSLFPEVNARGIANVQPVAQLITINGSGHLPHQEHPQLFLDAVNSWLEKLCSHTLVGRPPSTDKERKNDLFSRLFRF